MYEFVDRPVTRLDHGGRFLVWSMRSWVKAIHAGRCPGDAIGPAFGKWGMMPGLPHFHMMMVILNRDAVHSMNFGPLGCRRVREDEAVIISLVRGLYVGLHEHVRGTIAILVNEESSANMMTALTMLGQTMVEAGLFPGAPAHDPHLQDYGDE